MTGNGSHISTKPTAASRVTIRDVAARVGVSTASVSYALSGSPEVGTDLRERVLQAARELGYRPNKVAQQLRRGKTDAVGLLLADIANPFYADVASGVIAAATTAGFEVFVSHVGVDGERQTDAASAQLDRNSAGLLFTSVAGQDRELLEGLARSGVPFVQLHRFLEGVPADSVVVDNFVAAKELGESTALHCQKGTAILGGPEVSSVSRDRVRGFRQGATSKGAEIVNTEGLWGALTRESGAERALQLFRNHPDVDTVLCGNDLIALGVLDVCRDLGRQVPVDVAVAGFDDMSFSSAGPLQLTSVEVPRLLMGRRGFELLHKRIGGWTGQPMQEVLPHVLKMRATTRPLP